MHFEYFLSGVIYEVLYKNKYLALALVLLRILYKIKIFLSDVQFSSPIQSLINWGIF